MAKYMKKPIVVEAVQWTGENRGEIRDFATGFRRLDFDGNVRERVLIIETLEGKMKAQVGDFIIKGVQGEVYPCKPDIFEASYYKVSEDA